jgi:hypothetical protein
MFYAALYKPLPYRDPSRPVFRTEKWTAGNGTMSAVDLEYWRDTANAFKRAPEMSTWMGKSSLHVLSFSKAALNVFSE